MNDSNQTIIDKKPDSIIGNTIKTKDIARNLKKPESTIRKYGQDLEKNGYKFTKDPNGTRLFSREDEAAMIEYIRYREELGMSVDLAANAVVKRREKAMNDLSASNTKGSSEIQAIDFQQAMQQLIAQLPSKEQVSYLTQAVEQLLDNNAEITKRLIEKEKEAEYLKGLVIDNNEKLNKVVELYKSTDEKMDKFLKENEKKSFFRNLFSK